MTKATTLIALVLLIATGAARAQSIETVHQILSAFYTATDGDNWTNNDNWDITQIPTEQELNSWFGVTLQQGRLIRLDLPNNNLTGQLPPELGKLSQLQELRLWGNSLTGQLPPELGNLTQLGSLALSNNSLTGEIPPEIGNLTSLWGLYLNNNSLTGEIPPELGNLIQLDTLELRRNSLTGEIPPELGNLTELGSLNLRSNSLTGEIPPELGNLSQLWSLDLRVNSLTGEIPPELGNLSQLEHLYLDGNILAGEIPPELGNLAQLRSLGLGKNSLTGEIPPELGNLSQLWSLDLRVNSLTGEIPPELGNLSQLRSLWLYGNSLTGEIPPWLGNLPQLFGLGLSNNSLTGEIPPELSKLSQLTVLWLNDNSLTGEIPPWLGNFPLNTLDLRNNSLTGEIPPELGNLSQLNYLGLDGNSLTGEIPPELGNLTVDYLHLHDNSLTGEIPPELGNIKSLLGPWGLRLDGNSLTGEIPPELGNLTSLRGLRLSDNSLAGEIPPELGNLTSLQLLWLDYNHFTGVLPRSLMQLNDLRDFRFHGQALCAPADDEFQGWLNNSVWDVQGPTCGPQFASDAENRTFTVNRPVASLVLPEATGGAPPYIYELLHALPAGLDFDNALRTISGTPTTVTPAASNLYLVTDNFGITDALLFTVEVVPAVSFGDMITDLSFARAQPIDPLVLPEAAGGGAPVTYALTPALPAGLAFDATTRTLTGTPTVATDAPKPYTYSATGANGSRDSLLFTVEVFSPVAAERESLPESFVVHGNYPNPFRESTHLVFDLPWPASVTVEIMDVTGRRVSTVQATGKAAGWKHTIPLSGRAMSSGLYLYRLTATSPEGSSVHTGKFVRIR